MALLSSSLLALVLASCSSTEVWRGMWVTRWEFKRPDDVEKIIANCAELGCKEVLFQVRGSADAFYASLYEPWAVELGGRDPGFDPLAVAVAAAKAHGLKVHAWVNVVPGWRGLQPPPSSEHIFYKHPEWFVIDDRGRREALKENYYVALNPLLPEVREYIAKVLGDIVQRYDIDGLHLDYIRFLERPEGVDYSYDPRTLELYRQASGKSPGEDPTSWDRWRRQQLTELVAAIRRRCRRDGEPITLSAAVFAARKRARDVYFQDYITWLEQGLIDRILPMNYREDMETYEARLDDILAHAGDKPVTVGIGVFKHGDPSRTLEQIQMARSKSDGGVCLFSYESLFDSVNPGQDQSE